MKYRRILSYVQSVPWAITPEKLTDIVSFLAAKARGEEMTDEDIAARLGPALAARSHGTSSRGAVAVLPIRGTIAHRAGSLEEASGGISTDAIGAAFRQVMADPSVASVVLDVDSPGGTVTGIQELAQTMHELRGTKRVVAVTNGLNASAAYWLSSQADELVSIPSGSTGSIGVYAIHQDFSQALRQDGVTVTLVSAGAYKTEANPFEPLSADAKEAIQSRVEEAYAQFVRDVARGRGVSQSGVRAGYGQGRVLGAKDALRTGLIDRIATWDDVIGGLLGRPSSVVLGTRAEAVAPLSLSDRYRRMGL